MPLLLKRRHFWQAAALAVAMPAGLGAQPTATQSKSKSWPEQRQTGNLICHSTFSLERLGPVLADLENLQQDLIAHLGVPRASEPAHAFLFHSRDFYQRYIRQHFPDVGMRQALFIKQGHAPGMIFVYYHRQVSVDLRHESTHALLHGVLPMVPLWLDEGLAEYFESPRADRIDRSSHLRGVRWEARLGRVPDLRDLEGLRKMEEMRASDYRDAWAWTHFMLHGPAAARDELRRFLADIAAHTPPGLLSQRLRHRVPKLQDAYLSHFRRR